MDVFWLWIHTSSSPRPPEGSSWPWVFAWPKTKPLHFSVNCAITVTLQTSKFISNWKQRFETVKVLHLDNGRLENPAIPTPFLFSFFFFLIFSSSLYQQHCLANTSGTSTRIIKFFNEGKCRKVLLALTLGSLPRLLTHTQSSWLHSELLALRKII